MVKKKNSINQNFEALKAQMQAKRKLAENKFEEDKKTNVTPIKEIKKDEDEEYITLNIIDDEEDVQVGSENENQDEVIIEDLVDQIKSTVKQEEVLQEIIESEEKKSENSVRVITPISKKIESTPDINMNRIVLKKVEKQEAPKRITYYLKPETIKKIDKFSKAAGMGKSEFVQTILDEILNNLEIEK
ncbi:MAG: hypothetical protein ACRCTZ_03410 [Sarcina sp.]